ncbi:unnamed protein product [Closterium sp. NIES-53]
MHSRLLVFGLPRSLPPLPSSPAPPCLPCVEEWQRAAPHSSPFPPMTAPLQTLHMDVGGEFSSDLLRDFRCGEGILQSFTLPASPQQKGVAERHIGIVMEVVCTSMIQAAASHFLWPFAVCRFLFTVSSPTALPLSPPPPLFFALGPPPVDPLPPQGPSPSCVSQVDPLHLAEPVDVTVDSGAARGTASGGAEPEGAEPGGTECERAESGGAEPKGAEPGVAEPEGAEPWGAESEGSESRGAKPRGASLTAAVA